MRFTMPLSCGNCNGILGIGKENQNEKRKKMVATDLSDKKACVFIIFFSLPFVFLKRLPGL
jgi:hypothetical protein